MEDWKNEILDSLKGLEKAAPPSGSFAEIQRKIAYQQRQKSPKRWLAVAAAISTIAVANVYFISSYLTQETEINEPLQTGLFSNYNLYEE